MVIFHLLKEDEKTVRTAYMQTGTETCAENGKRLLQDVSERL